MALWYVSLALVCAIISLVIFLLQRQYSYWERRGVVFEKPVWLKGNLGTVGVTTSIREPFRDFYNKYKGQVPFGGFYFPLSGAAVLLDLDLVKSVMIKDFANFADRGNYYNEQDDPISAHIFNLDGPGWREMRTKLTPTFTSMKMQQMLPTVVEIGVRFIEVVRQEAAASSAVEMKDLMARFTTDVIGSCAFGLDCNSLNDPNVEFRVIGNKVFNKSRHGAIAMGLLQRFPKLANRLHIKRARDDASEFYMRIVRQTLDYRDKNNIKRNDFFNLLMEMREESAGGLTYKQLTAQAYVFFLAGFESSSSTMSFAIYLLAMNQDVQQKARDEVEKVLAKHGELNYEALKGLKYIHQIFYETMRMYSIASILIRKAINDYQVPGTSLVIEAGTSVVIPIDAIHYDSDIYPEPERFDPDRFTPEAVEQRHAMAWLPFGSGPRNCIGSRFGEMQSVIGLAMLLKSFRFSAAKETQIPLRIKKGSVALSSEAGIVLSVQPI